MIFFQIWHRHQTDITIQFHKQRNQILVLCYIICPDCRLLLLQDRILRITGNIIHFIIRPFSQILYDRLIIFIKAPVLCIKYNSLFSLLKPMIILFLCSPILFSYLFFFLCCFIQDPYVIHINIFFRRHHNIYQIHGRNCEQISKDPIYPDSSRNKERKICGKCYHKYRHSYFIPFSGI